MRKEPVVIPITLCQYRTMLGAAKNQFSLARAALITDGHAKSNFLPVDRQKPVSRRVAKIAQDLPMRTHSSANSIQYCGDRLLWLVAILLGGTLPVAAQAPAITKITMIGRVPQLTIQSPSGITNQIQYSTNLSQTKWVVLTNLLVGLSPYQVIDLGAQFAGQRFYRVAATSTFMTATLLQLWGSSGRTYLATNLIQQCSTPTPVNTSLAAFDAAHATIWIPVSYVPDWTVGTQLYWGSSLYTMRVVALGAGQIQCHTLSGYFGWGPGNLISQTLSYTMSSVLTAATNWKTPGAANTVVVTATAISASVGDVVWVGGVGADQFQIVTITR